MTHHLSNPILPSKAQCYGCGACAQSCSQGCITMSADDEGFLYPQVDTTACVECKKCERSCPSLSPYVERRPTKTFAAINNHEEVRLQSSSGGIFSLLAEQTIRQGGYVFGARFNDTWKVVHAKTNRIEDLCHLRGSKYVQSQIGNSYAEAKKLLEDGFPVMFVGTPCQIAGLNHFLGKEHEHLLTVDFICHGVPSPAVWAWYVEQQSRLIRCQNWKQRLRYWLRPDTPIRHIAFRNKDQGWKQYQTLLESKDDASYDVRQFHYENPYMRAFLADLDLRPSCSQCKMKHGRSHSDITLGDFWNVHKVTEDFDDDKGTSLILINSPKGDIVFSSLSCRSRCVDFDEAIQYNPAWMKAYPPHPRREKFFQQYKEHLAEFINESQ